MVVVVVVGGLRYKQENHFPLALRLFSSSHSLEKSLKRWAATAAQLVYLLQTCSSDTDAPPPHAAGHRAARLLEFRVLISVVNHIWSEDVINKHQQGLLNTHSLHRGGNNNTTIKRVTLRSEFSELCCDSHPDKINKDSLDAFCA